MQFFERFLGCSLLGTRGFDPWPYAQVGESHGLFPLKIQCSTWIARGFVTPIKAPMVLTNEHNMMHDANMIVKLLLDRLQLQD